MSASGEKTFKTTVNLTQAAIDKLDAIVANAQLKSRSAVVELLLEEVAAVREILDKTQHDIKAINFKDQSNTWAAVLNMSMAVGEAARRLERFDDRRGEIKLKQENHKHGNTQEDGR